MKAYVLSSLIAILFIIVSCSNPISDLSKDGLHGQIKMIIENAYVGAMNTEADTANVFSSIITIYDKKGNLLEKSFYDQGKMVQKIIPQRSHKRLIGNTRLNGDGIPMLTSTIRKISETEYEEIQLNTQGKLFSKEKMIFDHGRKISGTIYYQTVEYTTNYSFNNEGLLMSQTQKNNTGEEEYNYDYEYIQFDENKNWIRRNDYSSKGSKELKYTTIRRYEYY